MCFAISVSETDCPLFSVVIPTHDRADLLGRAVASVLGQTVTDLEVIVVDDAGSVPVAVPPDPRVRVVRRSVNGGAGACRNTGVELATGRYVAFLDDDDTWVPDRLELALAGLARAPIAVCWSRYADEPPAPKRRLDGDVADVILDAVTPPLDATALDRSLYVRHDERYRASEDVEWWLRQAAVAQVATVPRTGAVIRRSSDGSTREARTARLADSRRIIEDNATWFGTHPRAAAMRWQRLGLAALQVGDVATARSALTRSLRLRPGPRGLVHLARALRTPTPTAPADPTRAPTPVAGGQRILQVITDTDRRGAQVFATDLGAELAARGHAVTTVALAPGARGGELPIPVLGERRLGLPTLAALRRAAAGHDIVLAHGSSTLPACAVALAGTRVPFVYRQISDSLFWAPDRRRRARVRTFLARATAVIALSPGQSEVLVTHFGVPGGRITVIPNGVPSASFPTITETDRATARAVLDIPHDAQVVLSISALVAEKGVDLVIDAVAGLDDPDVHLLVAGDGPQRPALERQAARLGERVHLAGSLVDARSAYAAADVMVLASRGGDSMPATLVEAAFCEVPVIATPVGAITDVVVDGETGLVVPTDDVAALTAALGRVFGDPVEARALAVRARLRSMQRFEISAVAEQWERVLDATVTAVRR